MSNLPYYQKVYLDIFNGILSVHSNLLTDDEISTVNDVLQLEADPQRFMFRLLNRNRAWLRLDRLHYDEIQMGSVDLDLLSRKDLLQVDCGHLIDWISCLKLEELRTLAVQCGVADSAEAKRLNSQELNAILTSTRQRSKQLKISFDGGLVRASDHSIDLKQMVKDKFKIRIVKLSNKIVSLHDHLILPLFFISNPDDPVEDLRGAMLAQVEKRKYPSYHIIRSHPLFVDREAFEQYREAVYMLRSLSGIPDAISLKEECCNLLESFKWLLDREDRTRTCFLRRFTPLWLMAKCLESLASALESMKEYSIAVNVFAALLDQSAVCHGRRGDWWERLILDSHKHLKCDGTVLESLIACALEDPHVRMGSRLAISKRYEKFSNDSLDDGLSVPTDLLIKEHIRGAKGQSVKYEWEGELIGVEQMALRYYQEQGWSGMHSESGMFTMIFALIFWDIIFCSVPDTFQTPYQICPLDFRTDSFYLSRKTLIDDRLADIETGKYTGRDLLSSYTRHMGTMCVGVNWEAYEDEESLLQVFNSLGTKARSVIMKALALDYHNYASGMPDLVLWKENKIMLVEVKSENDRLSDQQKSWLMIFLEHKVDVRLLKVKSK